MTKIYIDARGKAGELADFLDGKGYRYGYNGRPCQRRSSHNTPFVTIDVKNGFYSGSKGADIAVTWRKLDNTMWEHLIMKMPDIREINKKNAYDTRPTHKHMLVESQDGRKMERVWYIATGREIPISRMNDDHLHNTILLVDRNIAAGEDQVDLNTDLAHLLNELEDERIHRGLHLPLVPLISLEYRKGNHSYV